MGTGHSLRLKAVRHSGSLQRLTLRHSRALVHYRFGRDIRAIQTRHASVVRTRAAAGRRCIDADDGAAVTYEDLY